MKKEKKATKMPKALRVIGNILLWLFVAFAVVVTILAFAAQNNADGVPALFGKCFLSVKTDSMKPTIVAGDMIISDKIDNKEDPGLAVGDVVTFKQEVVQGQAIFNTHRIIAIDAENKMLTTKGDNTEDNTYNVTEQVSFYNVIARWNAPGEEKGTKIAGLGAVLAFLQTSTGFLIVIVIPLILFFLFELVKFIRAAIAVKNEGKKQITAADEELIKQKAIEEYLRQQREAQENGNSGDASAPEGNAEPEKKPEEDHPFEGTADQEPAPEAPVTGEVIGEAERVAETVAEEVKEDLNTAEDIVTEDIVAEVKDTVETTEADAEAVADVVADTTETVTADVTSAAADAAEEAATEIAETAETASDAAEEIKNETEKAAGEAEDAVNAGIDAAESAAETLKKTDEND